MGYLVKVKTTSGRWKYLKSGHLVDGAHNGRPYPHPSNAEQARDNFLNNPDNAAMVRYALIVPDPTMPKQSRASLRRHWGSRVHAEDDQRE